MDPSWIATAFTAVNAVRVVFYVPQIVAVARSVDGARDIALSTWSMWALTNALGTAYGALVVNDLMLAASFALSLAACVLTIVLAAAKRVHFLPRERARTARGRLVRAPSADRALYAIPAPLRNPSQGAPAGGSEGA